MMAPGENELRAACYDVDINPNGYKQGWQEGYPLSSAWLLLGDPYQANQFRDTTDDVRAAALARLLKMELLADIASGHFICLGMSIPAPSDGMPGKVPETLFEDGDVDWDRDTLAAYGLRFASLRIAKPDKERAVAISSEPQKMGRPPINGFVDEAIRQLVAAGALERRQKKEMIELVREKIGLLYPGKFRANLPGTTKIKERLGAAGK